MKFRELVLGLGSLSFLTLIIFLSFLLADKFNVKSCGCPGVVSHNFVYLFIFLAAVFIACLVYYLASFKIESQKKVITSNKKIILSILDDFEKKVLNKILDSGGEIEQKKLTGYFGKLKTHRVIKKLKEKNIIDIKTIKNRNKLKIKKELLDELK